jgi:hypothetical protein
LHNVSSVSVNLQNGVFEHKNIADGNSAMASLLAVGPATAFNWTQAGSNNVSVRGGGNLMLVPAANSSSSINPRGLVATNIWDYAGQMTNDTVAAINAGSGESYGIMGSGQMMLDKNAAGLRAGSADDFFNFVGYQSYEAQAVAKRIVVSSTVFADQMAYTLAVLNGRQKYAAGSQIVRTASPAVIAGGGDMGDAFEVGALGATGDTQPQLFTISR